MSLSKGLSKKLADERLKELAKEIPELGDYELTDIGEDYIELQYIDAYEQVTILVQLKPLSELYSALRVTIERIDFDEEIPNPTALAQHDYPIEDLPDDTELQQALKVKIHKEAEYLFNRSITYEKYLKAVDCYLNIPHEHYYWTEKLSFVCDRVGEAKAFIELSDVMFALIKS